MPEVNNKVAPGKGKFSESMSKRHLYRKKPVLILLAVLLAAISCTRAEAPGAVRGGGVRIVDVVSVPEDTPVPDPAYSPETTPGPAPEAESLEAVPAEAQPSPEPTAAPEPTATPMPALPVIIDRFNEPERWADFAFDPDAELLQVIFPPIRDCDAQLILCGGESLLIDCASTEFAEALINMLKRVGVTHIDTVLITHPHHDHVNGFERLCQEVSVGQLLVCFPADYNQRMKWLLDRAANNEIPVRQYGDGDVITVGKATLTVYLRCPETFECNDRSAQLLMRYGDRTMYFAADIEKAGMRYLADSVTVGELTADILRYPHHGKAPLETDFHNRIVPQLCIITNKERDWKGQAYLKQEDVPSINTRIYGVVLTTDGKHWLTDKLYDQPVR